MDSHDASLPPSQPLNLYSTNSSSNDLNDPNLFSQNLPQQNQPNLDFSLLSSNLNLLNQLNYNTNPSGNQYENHDMLQNHSGQMDLSLQNMDNSTDVQKFSPYYNPSMTPPISDDTYLDEFGQANQYNVYNNESQNFSQPLMNSNLSLMNAGLSMGPSTQLSSANNSFNLADSTNSINADGLGMNANIYPMSSPLSDNTSFSSSVFPQNMNMTMNMETNPQMYQRKMTNLQQSSQPNPNHSQSLLANSMYQHSNNMRINPNAFQGQGNNQNVYLSQQLQAMNAMANPAYLNRNMAANSQLNSNALDQKRLHLLKLRQMQQLALQRSLNQPNRQQQQSLANMNQPMNNALNMTIMNSSPVMSVSSPQVSSASGANHSNSALNFNSSHPNQRPPQDNFRNTPTPPVSNQSQLTSKPKISPPAPSSYTFVHSKNSSVPKKPIQPLHKKQPSYSNRKDILKLPQDQFYHLLQNFYQTRNITPPTPLIEKCNVNLYQLFMTVLQFGGFEKVCEQQTWTTIKDLLFQTNSLINAAILRKIYIDSLFHFEEMFHPPRQSSPGIKSDDQSPEPQSSPNPSTKSKRKNNEPQKPPKKESNKKSKQEIRSPSIQSVNSVPTSEHDVPSEPEIKLTDHSPASIIPSPSPSDNIEKSPPVKGIPVRNVTSNVSEKTNPNETTLPSYSPFKRKIDTFGGYNLSELPFCPPKIPTLHDIGTIDIHHLTMSIQSRLKMELTYSINILLMLTADRNFVLPIGHCDQLIEALIDYQSDNISSFNEQHSTHKYSLDYDYGELLKDTFEETSSFHPSDQFEGIYQEFLATLYIFRNISFSSENQQYLAKDPSFLEMLEATMNIHTGQSKSFLLELRKCILMTVSNISLFIVLKSSKITCTLVDFLLSFFTHKNRLSSNDSAQYYQNLCFEIFSKLSLTDHNRFVIKKYVNERKLLRFFKILHQQVYFHFRNFDFLNKHIMKLKLVILCLYNLVHLEDPLMRKRFLQEKGFIALLIRLFLFFLNPISQFYSKPPSNSLIDFITIYDKVYELFLLLVPKNQDKFLVFYQQLIDLLSQNLHPTLFGQIQHLVHLIDTG